ncbi:S-adenosyl-L-methionine-dependent methyltransferase [Cucurbitaria berberidis CBS 394.84]|uniref:S-adenosyl-L-methionine-dependent methyltransferase n=1 Tax=Cucurbitaria berberidis CBS 394.84 TaxID=1168544 RepID=A0A9P4L8J4_9PLEO|nr:S-adenosyl-L-methionine-dependent methyltransferase [Cucurbitaria berberidis CBS 394.84]KAF1846156.1 S-adenosyl-L-methionine-dependent methyltransferase [Cucurbitaria berberidis CBS 394.84]
MSDALYAAEPADIDVDTEYSDFQEEDDNDADRMSYATQLRGGSLASNITRYRYENGRRYHAYRDGTYYQPNDAQSQSYEAIVHHLWLLTLHDKLFLAPLANPARILDIGSGTGLWAVDIADHFPHAEVTATDLSPILYTSAPPNLTYEIDDANLPWTYPPNHFDFVHIRGLTGCIRSWSNTYAQVYEHLQPGGWVEHLEFSVDTSADPHGEREADRMFTAFSNSMIGAGEKTGMTFSIVRQMGQLMHEAGFVDIHDVKFIWPIGTWPKDAHLKDLGRWGERNWSEGIEGWILALYTRVLGWTYAEVQDFAREFRRVIKNRKNHLWHEVRCVYARKPFDHEIVRREEKRDGGE